MELYAGAALTGIGYMLQQQRDAIKPTGFGAVAPGDAPSMDNLYASDYWRAVKRDEEARGTERFQAAQDPLNTGMVPKPAYASMFQSVGPAAANTRPGDPVTTLAGESLTTEQFVHNNMTPFFRGHVRQNVDPAASAGVVERNTGTGGYYQTKEEIGCFFQPSTGIGNVCGMDNNNDYYQRHIEAPKARNNEFPIEQVRVGPGLGQGFTSQGVGGFQQEDLLDLIRPKNVDELRVATNPKLSYEIPVQGPQKGIAQRGSVGEFAKNRPDTYYEQSADQWIKTTGAVTREAERPVVQLKPTARVEGHIMYEGPATNTREGRGDANDYGRASITVYDNERTTTQTRTVIANVQSMVKAIVAPILDVFRRTKQEYTVEAARTFGNMQAQIPDKATVYDPVMHAMRTTIKETTIHDTTIMNPRGPDAVPVQGDDEARTTNRETLEVEDTVRNVSAHTYKVTVYNVDEVAKKTIRETTEDAAGSMYGFVGGPTEKSVGAYTHVDVQVPATQKQFVSDHEHIGQAGAKAEFRPMSEEAARNAEIDGTREALNIASSFTPAAGGGYVGLSGDAVEMATRKLAADEMAQRNTGNVTRVLQPTAMSLDGCEAVTKPQFLPNANENRLDPGLLSVLKSNPYNLSVNPIAA